MLDQVARGDVEAFAGLVDLYQDRLVRLCERYLGHREDALDAAQEIARVLIGEQFGGRHHHGLHPVLDGAQRGERRHHGLP